MNYCVYIHENKISGKKYCGITNNTKRRWRNDGIEYKPSGQEGERPFWNAIVKYGWDGFEHKIIEENLTFKQACEKEKHYIKTLELQKKKYGYNVADGGDGGKIYAVHPKGMKGKSQTKYQIEKMKELRKDFNPMENIKWGVDKPHPKGMLGKKHTEEHKIYMSQKLKGRYVSEETKKKMSESFKGRKYSDETRRKMSEAQKGKKAGVDNTFSRKCVVVRDGVEKQYISVQKAMDDLNISTCLFYRLIKSGEEYTPRGNVKNRYKHLEGIKIKYL